MSDRALRLAVVLLALAGAGISAYLAYARYADAAIACATGGCETVQSSAYAEVLGVPVAAIGLGGYLTLLATALVPGDTARLAGAGLALGGLVFSIYLVVVQVVAVGAFCQWCLASDAVMGLLCVAAVWRLVPGWRPFAAPSVVR